MASLAEAAKTNPLFRRAMALAAGVIVLDQITKLWVLHGIKLAERPFGHWDLTPFFDLTYVENRGVSFGLFAGGMVSRVALSVLALAVAVFVIRWAATLDRKVAALGAGFIVGGAIGNVIDRVFYGYVVDFLDVSGLMFPWQFNIADVAINLGVACLAWDAFIDAPKELKKTEGGSQAPDDASVSVSTDLSNKTVTDKPFPKGERRSIESPITSTRNGE